MKKCEICRKESKEVFRITSGESCIEAANDNGCSVSMSMKVDLAQEQGHYLCEEHADLLINRMWEQMKDKMKMNLRKDIEND
jgi:hypothetical protein